MYIQDHESFKRFGMYLSEIKDIIQELGKPTTFALVSAYDGETVIKTVTHIEDNAIYAEDGSIYSYEHYLVFPTEESLLTQ